MKVTLASIQSLIAPFTVPVAPAVLLGNEIYQVMRSADVVWFLALVGAIAAAVGLEVTGGATCYAAVRAASRNEWWSFTIAGLGTLVYMVVVAGAMLILPQQRAQIFVVFAILTPVAYAAYALVQDIRERDRTTNRQLNYDLELMRQKRLTINAQTRLAQAERSPVRSGGEHFNQGAQTDDGYRAIAFAYLDEHGKVSVRQLAGGGHRHLYVAPRHRDGGRRLDAGPVLSLHAAHAQVSGAADDCNGQQREKYKQPALHGTTS